MHLISEDSYVKTTLPDFIADGERLSGFLDCLFSELAAGKSEKAKELLVEDLSCDWSKYWENHSSITS